MNDLAKVKIAIASKRLSDRYQQLQTIDQRQPAVVPKIGSRDARSGLWSITLPDGSTSFNGQKITNADTKPITPITVRSSGNLLTIDSKLAPTGKKVKSTGTSETANKTAKYTGNQLKNQGYLSGQIYTIPVEDTTVVTALVYLYYLIDFTGRKSYYVGGLKKGSQFIKTFSTSQTVIHASVDYIGKNKFSCNFIYNEFGSQYTYGVERFCEYWSLDTAKSWRLPTLQFDTVGNPFFFDFIATGYGYFRSNAVIVKSEGSNATTGSLTETSRTIILRNNRILALNYVSRTVIYTVPGSVAGSDTVAQTYTKFFTDQNLDGVQVKDSSLLNSNRPNPSYNITTRFNLFNFRTNAALTIGIGNYFVSNVGVNRNRWVKNLKDGSFIESSVNYTEGDELGYDYNLFNGYFTAIDKSETYITYDQTTQPVVSIVEHGYDFKARKTKEVKTFLPTIKDATFTLVNYSYYKGK